jgi:hypothetical protein
MTITVGFLASTTAARAAGTRCATDAHHQFDFWLGEWEVRRNDAAAPVVGHNTIARIDGCTLLESWRGADGGTGHSMNAYDAASRSWRQFWVGSGGMVLPLEGGLSDTAMILLGELPNPKTGRSARQRVSFTPRPDGSVRQHWESSNDGEHWETVFDGIYRHPPGAALRGRE